MSEQTPLSIKKKHNNIGIQKAFIYGEKYPWVDNAMLEFGEQCFNAGSELADGWEAKIENTPKYESFKQYLKTLKDE